MTSQSPISNTFPRKIIQTLLAGLATGAIAVSNTISYAAIIFAGDLSSYLAQGIGLTLFGGLLLITIISLTSSTPGTISFPKSATAPILALIVAQVFSDLGTALSSEEIFITLAATLAVSTAGTGIFLFLFGLLRFGRWIRYMPYPVLGGFLAGLGWLLIKGGLDLTVQIPLDFEHLHLWFTAETILRWAPGLILALLLLTLQRRFPKINLVPTIILGGLGIYYLSIWLFGIPMDKISAGGWLLGPFPSGNIWKPLILLEFPKADWAVIIQQSLTMLTLIPTTLISLLFNSSSVELASKQEVNFDHELTSAGIANIFSGFAGGIIGYHSASLTTLAAKMRAGNRFTGLIAASIFGLTIFYGAALLPLIPKMIIEGLLIYLGLTFLVQWVFESRHQLPLTEFLILLLILFVIVSIGLLQGVLVGVLATAVLFALNYSQINIVRNVLSGKTYQSTVERASHYQDYLQENGDLLYIIKLQGFIFFGTAHSLYRQIKDRVDDRQLSKPRFVILDFRFVSGIDSSALNSFIRLRHQAEQGGYNLLFADLSPDVQQKLKRGGILVDDSVVLEYPDSDHAVEWCEEALLDNTDVTALAIPTLRGRLKEFFPPNMAIDDFMSYLKESIVDEGEVLIRRGDVPNGIYLVERGQVTVQLTLDSGETTRLRRMGTGAMVGEIGTYLDQLTTATVITDMPSMIYFLSKDKLRQMEVENPAIAAAFHKYVAVLTSQRLLLSNLTLQALLD